MCLLGNDNKRRGGIASSRRHAPRSVLIAVALVAGLLGSWDVVNRARAQDALPSDVAQSITALVQKFGTLKDDRAKLDAALKRLDAEISPLRNKDEYAKSIAAELTTWLNDLSDQKKETVRADAVFTGLFAATDRVRDGNDFLRATRHAGELQKTLAEGRFKMDERDALATALGTLSVEAEKFLKDRPLRLHIISATYGVQGTNRSCDATGYFRAKCEGQAKCPPQPTGNAEPAPISITGTELCGTEPAPHAPPQLRVAKVKYKCIRFGLRPWADIEKNENLGTTVDLVGKGQITCDFR